MARTDAWRCSCRTPAVGVTRRPERKKAALCGCGLLENVADLAVQRCRRTRRDPSSSNERRRKVTRSWVRLSVMMRPYNRRPGAVKGSEAGDAAVKVVLIGPFDLRRDDLADAQRAAARDIDRAVDLGRVRLGAAL